MQLSAIYLKEWLKLRGYALGFAVVALLLGGLFWFDLSGQYANIEPESMMWYRFSHLGDKPYTWLQYSFVLIGGLVAACQFVPEVMGRKVRILTHLPVSLSRVVRQHLLAGSLMTLVVNSLSGLVVVVTMSRYYPADIVQVTVRDMLFSQLAALAVYLGLAAAIVESEWKRRSVKVVLAVLACYVLLQERYQVQHLAWLALILWMSLLLVDSFLSVKSRRLDSVVYTLSVPLVVAVLAGISGQRLYQQYATEHTRYYVFYSPVLEEYVYQQNGAHHTFFYGTPDRKLDKAQFETALPFVYWKNLDIQGRLPVTIDGERYGKRQIRNARMSLQYQPSHLAEPEVALYPLFNPISHKGSIPFPENALALKSDRFEVFAAETASTNQPLTDEINQLAAGAGVEFPLRGMWGKTTNMKPFDWGYFVKDSHGALYNLRRQDDVVTLNAIEVPQEAGEIDYIQVSENRHKKFYGYAISKTSQVYLISYPDYRFIPLELDNFDHHTMSFQLLADPLYYLVRINDGERYSAVRYDKSYNKLDQVLFQ